MKTISIDPSAAIAAHSSTGREGKAVLETLFGKDLFGSITDKVKSFEDACRLLGQECSDEYINSGSKDEVAYKKLKLIAAALNERWIPDWSDDEQYKYYPWFIWKGSGFSFFSVGYLYGFSHLGSRLCFRTRELAEYAGTHFLELYNDFLR